MAVASRKTKQQLIEEIEALRKQLDSREPTPRTEPAESRPLYEILAQSSHAGVYVILDGRFDFLNDKAALLAGYTAGEMIGVRSIDIVHPEDREAVLEQAVAMLKGHRSVPYEYRIITKDGQIRWIMETVTPIEYRGRRAVLGNAMDITAQKERSRRLKELEALEASILDAIPHAVLGLAKRHIIFANDAVDAVFGWRPEELIGKTTRILYRSDEEYADIGKFLYSTLRRQRTCSAEIPCRRMDGREIVVRLHASRIGASLREGRIIAVYEDITQRRRSEKALRESERFNKEIISSANEGIIVYDREFRFIVWNRFMEELTGLAADAVLGVSAFDVFPHLRDQGVDLLLDRALEGATIAAPDLTYYVPQSGKTGWIAGTYAPYRNSRGEIVGVIAMVHDITERKLAEEALRKSEENFRAIFETAPDCIFIKDRALKYVLVNPSVETLFGKPASEIVGLSDGELFGEEAEQRTREMDYRVLDGEMVEVEYSETINGVPVTLHVVKVPMFDDAGVINGICGIARDITQTRQLEAQLLQAQKMEAIGTLAGGIAHDFNNLLMGIQGHVSLMLMDVTQEHPHAVHLTGIEDMIRSGATLTRQLLGFARGGKYEVKPTDLNDLLRRSSEMFGRTKKEIKITRREQEGLWVVDADRGQIEQVFLNMYVNAWQAMPGGGELTLATQNMILDEQYVKPHKAKPGRYVRISITDTGIGMDEATRQRVFEPFFTTKGRGRGTGLGLASAYGIIRNHGGFITLYSERGHGTTFNLYLPVSSSGAVADASLDRQVVRGTETILIVDDEDIVLDVGIEVLKTLGYRVLAARGGREAIEIYRQKAGEIDMVILDMIMPEMGGGRVFDAMQAVNPSVKVLLASGYSLNGQAAQILSRGCGGFIQKPFSIIDLSKKIREILDKPEEKRAVA
ncbi:MAG: PAS domain S-box protein [Syntrophobacterales bacterium]|nr:PAS domain S-box protein [Syntrophobacterales bacterium]